MIEILGKKFMTVKEASYRYKYSVRWFEDQRYKGKPPQYIKPSQNKIYYPLDSTDEYFRKKLCIVNEE